MCPTLSNRYVTTTPVTVIVTQSFTQEDIWESIIVKRTNIGDYKITGNKFIKILAHCLVVVVNSAAVPEGYLLLLTVNCPLSSLTSFPCTARGNNLQVYFAMNPSQPLEHLLHKPTKTSTVMTPVQLGSSKKLSSKAQSGPQQMSSNIQTPDKVEEVDVSPIDPLGTPVMVSL